MRVLFYIIGVFLFCLVPHAPKTGAERKLASIDDQIEEFCKYPVAEMCKSQQVEDHLLASARREILANALATFREDLAYNPYLPITELIQKAESTGMFSLTRTTHLDEKTQIFLARFDSEYEDAANAYIYKMIGRVPFVDPEIRKVFDEAQNAAKQFYLESTGPSAKMDVIRKIQGVKLFTAKDFVENHDAVLGSDGKVRFKNNPSSTVNPEAEKFRGLYLSVCHDSQAPKMNAAWLPLDINENAFVICPGFIQLYMLRKYLGVIVPTADLVTLHEVGHMYVDTMDVKSLAKCLYKPEYGLDLGMPEEHQAFINRAFVNEVAADQVAVRGLASILSKIKSRQDRYETLKSALNFFCSRPSSDDHPGDHFRILQFRRDPEISRLLGCKSKTEQPLPACTIHGPASSAY